MLFIFVFIKYYDQYLITHVLHEQSDFWNFRKICHALNNHMKISFTHSACQVSLNSNDRLTMTYNLLSLYNVSAGLIKEQLTPHITVNLQKCTLVFQVGFVNPLHSCQFPFIWSQGSIPVIPWFTSFYS